MALKRCNMCDRTFTKLEHLKRHERSHTKERPYECPTCNKCFSRSDVLFRHCKGHAQVALTRNTSSEDRNQRGSAGSMGDIHDPHLAVSRTEADQDLAPTSQTREPMGNSPSARTQGSSVPQHGRGHQIDALINAAQHLEPSWQSSAPTLLARTDEYHLAGSHHMGLSPPIDPAINVIPYPPAGNVPGLDQWTFDLVHSNHQTLSRTPTDSLQSWLFPQNGSLQIQDGSHHMELDGVLNDDVLSRPPNAQTSPSGSTASIVSRIPCERFARVANCWPSRVWRPSRLMPSLWQSLASCKHANILSDIPSDPGRRTIDKNSTWRLDEQHRSALQDALNVTSQQNTASPNTQEQTMSMDFRRNSGSDLDRAQFPPAEILDIALEMYLNYFHPTLPLIHIPTFSVHNTSQPLLLSMCLIGLSILGTTGAVKFVTQTFPAVLHLVISELRSLSSSHRPPHQQMRVIATSLLALNLASITGRRNRIAQAEQLYIELLTISQNQGLFTIEDGSNAGSLLNAQQGNEEKWATWTNFECAKRIIYGLIEADCWWAGYLSTSPIIRSEDVRVFPTAPENLYQAESFTKWLSLIDRGARTHTQAITAFLGPNPDARLGTAGSVWNLLILISLRMYEYNDRLSIATADSNQLEPWRIYDEDQRSRDIVSLVVSLSSTSDVLHSTDLNSVVLWHASCMKMGANMQCFELAAGRGGAEPAASALEDISSWSQTSSARRSILHAAQIFRILSDRKVSDIIHPHSVVALFQSALVLGLYIFTLPFDNSSDHYIELTDPLDWVSMGRLGLAERAHSSAIGEKSDVTKQFIANGGPFSLSGARLEGGYLPARKTLLHCADLMEGMGRWKSTTFSQILHIMSDDLTDDDSIDHSKHR